MTLQDWPLAFKRYLCYHKHYKVFHILLFLLFLSWVFSLYTEPKVLSATASFSSENKFWKDSKCYIIIHRFKLTCSKVKHMHLILYFILQKSAQDGVFMSFRWMFLSIIFSNRLFIWLVSWVFRHVVACSFQICW